MNTNNTDIKQARINAGLTQEEASSLLQFPIRVWQRWEEGIASPPAYIRQLILKRLKSLEK